MPGSAGSAGAGGPAGGSPGSGGAAGGSTVAGGNGGGSNPDAGGGDAVSDATRLDAAGDADATCVRETNVAFCLRLQKDCGDTTAPDNCGNTATFNCGTCAGQLVCGGAGQANVCGTPVNLAQGGTVTSSNPGVSPEDMTKAFDGMSATKWFAGNGVKVGWIAYQFAAAASHTVTSYTVTSANDVPGRDPSAWQLQGSSDGQAWTTVDTRTAQTFAARFQVNRYVCTNPGAYPRYRLNITANSGGADLQLAEIQLFGQ